MRDLVEKEVTEDVKKGIREALRNFKDTKERSGALVTTLLCVAAHEMEKRGMDQDDFMAAAYDAWDLSSEGRL